MYVMTYPIGFSALLAPAMQMRKNPFLSAWLSGANTAMSMGRAFWVSELQRQNAVLAQQAVRFWTMGVMSPLAWPGAKAFSQAPAAMAESSSVAQAAAASVTTIQEAIRAPRKAAQKAVIAPPRKIQRSRQAAGSKRR